MRQPLPGFIHLAIKQCVVQCSRDQLRQLLQKREVGSCRFQIIPRVERENAEYPSTVKERKITSHVQPFGPGKLTPGLQLRVTGRNRGYIGKAQELRLSRTIDVAG